MTDFFLLLKIAGAGDELQGIKRGIVEMADAIVINKADGDNIQAAKLAQTDFNNALHLYPAKESDWTPRAMTCSSVNNTGISEIWDLISGYTSHTKDNGFFERKRAKQNEYWLLQTIESTLKRKFFDDPKVRSELERQLKLLNENKTSPFEAANKLLNLKKI
jgi:LAO/AO transport system kinase